MLVQGSLSLAGSGLSRLRRGHGAEEEPTHLFLQQTVEKDLFLQPEAHVRDSAFVPGAECGQAGRQRAWDLGRRDARETSQVNHF